MTITKEMTQEQITMLQELLQDAAFVEELVGKETTQEVQDLFLTKGIAFTEEEAAMILKTLDEAVSGSGELKESDLDNVSGGGFNIFHMFMNVNGNSLLVNLTERCAMIRLRLINRRPYQC